MVDPQFGVGEAALRPLIRGGALSRPNVSIDRLAQVRGRSLVDLRELIQNRFNVAHSRHAATYCPELRAPPDALPAADCIGGGAKPLLPRSSSPGSKSLRLAEQVSETPRRELVCTTGGEASSKTLDRPGIALFAAAACSYGS